MKSCLNTIGIEVYQCFANKNFLKDFIYLFLERREGKEKERERNINMLEIH